MFIPLLISVLTTLVRAQSSQDPPVVGCYDSVNQLLSGNTLFRADAFLVQVNQVLLNSRAGSITTADVAEACAQGGPDSTGFCSLYQNSPSFVAGFNGLYTGVLTGLRDCLNVYIAGGPDYQIDYRTYTPGVTFTPTDPNTPVPSQRKRAKPDPAAQARAKRWSVINERVKRDVVQPMTPIKRSFFELGPMNARGDSDGEHSLQARQTNNCRDTVRCFTTCPSCATASLLCGIVGENFVDLGCDAIGTYVGSFVGRAAISPCFGAAALACVLVTGPGVALCTAPVFAACIATAAYVSGKAIEKLCSSDFDCNFLKDQCQTCNVANLNVCPEDSSVCCAGETGTRCGFNGCCCCPQCQAPAGPNCECAAAAC